MRLVPRIIEIDPDENGKKERLMVAYTNREEVFCGPETNTCTVKAGNFFNTVLFKEYVEGIVINSFGDEPFHLNKQMIKELFQYFIESGPCKSEKYYDEHEEDDESAPQGIDLKDILVYAIDIYKDKTILTTSPPTHRVHGNCKSSQRYDRWSRFNSIWNTC